MNISHRKTILSAVVAALGIFAAGQAMAQADSTTGNGVGNWNAVIPRGHLDLPAVPTPIVYQNTYTTQQVTQQITQVVQPNTYQVSGSGQGQTTAAAWANCGGGTLLGGGGSCTDGQGLVAVGSSEPSGNSWVIGCQSLNYKVVYATAYAVCSAN